jgi:hypothetical protein
VIKFFCLATALAFLTENQPGFWAFPDFFDVEPAISSCIIAQFIADFA